MRHMQEVLATNDPVLLSYAEMVLKREDIELLIADQHMSVLEGSLGILPRRLLVMSEDLLRARVALTMSGIDRALLTTHPDMIAGGS
jgi:Putative prokaryotic signal transducing protein